MDSGVKIHCRQRDEEGERELEPDCKRARLRGSLDDSGAADAGAFEVPQDVAMTDSRESLVEKISLPYSSKVGEYDMENLLPPSRSLLPAESLSGQPAGQVHFALEADVGITEYVGKDVPPFSGIIKQRYRESSLAYPSFSFLHREIYRFLGV